MCSITKYYVYLILLLLKMEMPLFGIGIYTVTGKDCSDIIYKNV
jgi:hypothetical protein